MLPGNLLHPLKLDIVGFKEEDHDYHFRVELPEPSCCQSCGYADEKPGKYGKDDEDYAERAEAAALVWLKNQTTVIECPNGIIVANF